MKITCEDLPDRITFTQRRSALTALGIDPILPGLREVRIGVQGVELVVTALDADGEPMMLESQPRQWACHTIVVPLEDE